MRHFDLTIELTKRPNLTCLNHHFSNLEHIKLPDYSSLGREKIYENIFELNPQLRSIQVPKISDYDILRMANEKLPHLERIQVWSWGFSKPYNNGTIRFKNVKRFHIEFSGTVGTVGADSIIYEFIPLEFDQLEELEFVISSLIQEKWIRFI